MRTVWTGRLEAAAEAQTERPPEPVQSRQGVWRLVSACTIFLGAFLLFQIQPLIAKMILPWFGGTAAVWTTCMLFFQLVLLLGYLYAHWLNSRLSSRWQGRVHATILILSAAALPVLPDASWKPSGQQDPVLLILGLLGVTVGLPYFVLSSTSPLVQAWCARHVNGGAAYRLFALSNLASLMALLAYPVLIEPWIGTNIQAWLWSGIFLVYALLFGSLATGAARSQNIHTSHGGSEAAEAPSWRASLTWLTLAACASILMLAVTNHLCQNVAAIPFLWILPLGVYLLSFILCFERDGWYRRGVFHPLHAIALGAAGFVLLKQTPETSLRVIIPFFTAALLAFCMYCHGELALRKPAPRYLTRFYLMVALGGALGGVTVALLAPRFLPAHFDLPIAIAGCALLTLMLEYRKNWMKDIVWTSLAIGLTVMAATYVRSAVAGSRILARNFYGGLRVMDVDAKDPVNARRMLVHGVISHGSQFLAPERREVRTTYYADGTGVDLAFRHFRRPRMQAGLIGLGAGTLAACARPGDTFRFYEINPLVVELARTEFTYLKDSRGDTEIVIADGRLGLERDRERRFHILVVDAFSGDSIPVHLLTREAFQLYFDRLEPDGILALHISNTALDIAPVVERTVSAMNKAALLFVSERDPSLDRNESVWVLVTNDAATLAKLRLEGQPLPVNPRLRPWTDDYSNLFQILK